MRTTFVFTSPVGVGWSVVDWSSAEYDVSYVDSSVEYDVSYVDSSVEYDVSYVVSSVVKAVVFN